MKGKFIYILTLLISIFVGEINAQEKQDSLRVKGNVGLNEEDIKELTNPIISKPLEANSSISALDSKEIAIENSLNDGAPKEIDLHYDIMPKGSYLPRWATGYMYGYNSSTSSLMYGNIRTAGFGVQQRLGEYWTANIGVDLAKYAGFYNTATFNASVTWQPNRYFSTTIFGSYMPGSFFSNISVVPSIQWGGYITLQTDTDLPFGVDLGAYDSYDSYYGHNVTPIVKPFVNLGGAKLGIDFGPMIKDAIWKANGGVNGGNGFNPIPKPMKAVTPIGPRN